MLGGRNQSQKDKLHMISLCEVPGVVRFILPERREVLKAWGGRRGESVLSGDCLTRQEEF